MSATRSSSWTLAALPSVPSVASDGTVTKETRDTLSGSWRPSEAEVTQAIRFGQENAIVVKALNKQLNELGTGGIMKIVMLYSPGEPPR